MKIKSKIIRIAWGIIILLIGIYMFARPHINCEEEMGQLYMNGFLEKKYEGERRRKFIAIKTTNGISKISLSFYGDALYNYLQPGDLIEKEIGSLEVSVFRKGHQEKFTLCVASENYDPSR